MIEQIWQEITNDPPKFFRDAEGKPVAWAITRSVLAYLGERLDARSVTLETGAGVSTVAFALLGCLHTCIVPSEEVIGRITDFCRSKDVDLGRVNFVADRSEHFLPRAALPPLDLVLIDGCHGFPAPFLDWYYSSLALKVGGEVLVDDTQIWTGRVLVDFLRMEPEWEFRLQLGKTAVIRKRQHVARVKEWSQQPFVVAEGTELGQR